MISNVFSGQLLDRYDQIVLMNQGTIMAQDTHSELLRDSNEYRKIRFNLFLRSWRLAFSNPH